MWTVREWVFCDFYIGMSMFNRMLNYVYVSHCIGGCAFTRIYLCVCDYMYLSVKENLYV